MSFGVPGSEGLHIPRTRVWDGDRYRLTEVCDNIDTAEKEKQLRRTLGARVRIRIIRIRGSGHEERYAIYVC